MRWWVAVAWIDDLLKEGEKRVDEVEVYWYAGRSVSADLKKKKISLCTSSVGTGISIRTIEKGRIGISGTSNPEQWQACLDAAIAGGRLASQEDWQGLPGPAEITGSDLSFDPGLSPEPEAARDLIRGMLDGADAYEKAEVTSGGAELATGEILVANNRGVRYRSRQTEVSISLETICGRSTGYEFDHAYRPGDLDPSRVGKRAAELAVRSADAKDIPTGDYDIVLSPMAYADLLSNIFVPALSGKNVLQGRSKLAGMIGEEVTAPLVSLYDDPHRPGAGGSTWFDAEGMPTKRLDFVRDGILKGFAYDLKTAYRAKTASTASAIRGGAGGLPAIGHHNIVLDGKRDEVLSEPALYVHSVVGAHTANPLSGEFSVEVSNAFLAEKGEWQTPVKSAMIAGNFFGLQKNIAALGKEGRSIGSYILPAVRINNVRVIGK